MIELTTTIKKFDKQGEKTGWTYIEINEKTAQLLNPGVKTSYRVKGFLDAVAIEKQALLPMGDGSFILTLNAALRKALKKQKGAEVKLRLQVDKAPVNINAEFLDCLADEPSAQTYFLSLAQGHRNYFSKWIESAKSDATKAKRIALAVNALAKGWGYPQMMRAQKKDNQQ